MHRFLVLLVLAVSFAACGERSADQPRVAFITNCVADFWRIGEAGARAAGAEFGVDVDVRMPPNNDPFEQKQMVEDVLTRGAVGIAISPIDPANQLELLDAAASRVPLVTHDSDAPGSGRRCYVGMDNYEAGRMAAELVRQALPGGGVVALFVGNLAQDNARGR
ncbi:MAG: D-ribose-binding periplasmic protein precursor, partial [Planctomycetota bacterium]